MNQKIMTKSCLFILKNAPNPTRNWSSKLIIHVCSYIQSHLFIYFFEPKRDKLLPKTVYAPTKHPYTSSSKTTVDTASTASLEVSQVNSKNELINRNHFSNRVNRPINSASQMTKKLNGVWLSNIFKYLVLAIYYIFFFLIKTRPQTALNNRHLDENQASEQHADGFIYQENYNYISNDPKQTEAQIRFRPQSSKIHWKSLSSRQEQ